MKNPNGYGTVVKLSGNRRKPFAVRKTTGWNDKGHPIYLAIGYTETREEGMILLASYNNEPWDIKRDKVTLKMLFERWAEVKLPKLGESSQSSSRAAFNHCYKYHNAIYRKLKAIDMQDCIDNCGKGYSTQAGIKTLFGHLDKFAFEIDIIEKMYSCITTAPPIPETTKTVFSDLEIQKLWDIKDQDWVDSILIFLYTGFRINELLGLKTENVDLKNRLLKGGSKTDAGKNRIVPIHPIIFDIVKKRAMQGNEYLFSNNRKNLTKHQYYIFWNAIMDQLEIDKTPHECRHTFRSKLDSAGANKKCIDMMMGHKSKDVGERTYTHKTVEELRKAIELITR